MDTFFSTAIRAFGFRAETQFARYRTLKRGRHRFKPCGSTEENVDYRRNSGKASSATDGAASGSRIRRHSLLLRRESGSGRLLWQATLEIRSLSILHGQAACG